MPLSLSNDAITEKNKLNSSGAFLVLLEIGYPDESPENVVYVVNNNENIVWPSGGGNTYLAYPFQLGDITQDSEGSIPTVDLTVVDISRQLISIVDDYDGAVGATAIVRIVHSDHLDNATAEYSEAFEIVDTSVDGKYNLKFKLGAENPLRYRIPQDRYLKDHCRYKTFKGEKCGYSGGESECDRTFARCRELGTPVRFGGFPGCGGEAYNA
jgi:lambda family phage minor tail protein L